jgi:hypothetical protein
MPGPKDFTVGREHTPTLPVSTTLTEEEEGEKKRKRKKASKLT